MHKQIGMQWRPGIDMFEGHVFWSTGEAKQVVRCWVRWNSTSEQGALELCKSLEATIGK